MNTAEQLISSRDERPTAIRVAVLDLLLREAYALTPAEILDRLQALGEFDRVTIYRVLDWLVGQGLAHKVEGTGRATCYQASRDDTTHSHAHFQCLHCGKIYCLAQIRPALMASLPENFTAETIELNIKGICAACK